jgi:hypothetical protein
MVEWEVLDMKARFIMLPLVVLLLLSEGGRVNHFYLPEKRITYPHCVIFWVERAGVMGVGALAFGGLFINTQACSSTLLSYDIYI